MNLYDFVTGKLPIEECMEMEEVGSLTYNSILEGHMFTIEGVDYLIPAIPKDNESCPVLRLKK